MKIRVKVEKLVSYGMYENAKVGIELEIEIKPKASRDAAIEALYLRCKKFVFDKCKDMKASRLLPPKEEASPPPEPDDNVDLDA